MAAMSAPTMLAEATARGLLDRAAVTRRESLGVRQMRSGNRVFEIACGTERFYVKFPAKDFVANVDPLTQAAARVAGEAAAFECLRQRGLSSIDVLGVEPDADNPSGWPCILLSGAAGRPLIDVVRDGDPPRALLATGAYLAAMHAITFAQIGYISTAAGPGPDPAGRLLAARHDPDVLQREAWSDLSNARPHLHDRTFRAAEARLDGLAERVADEYETPYFVHGALHPNHPFIHDGVVSALIDLDNASAGAVFDDLLTLTVGLMIQAPHTPWWDPLFDGYGVPQDIERYRDGLLSCAHYCFREHTRSLEATYDAILGADEWADLFHAHRP
jgi:aminoglycoside phosphotransferase